MSNKNGLAPNIHRARCCATCYFSDIEYNCKKHDTEEMYQMQLRTLAAGKDMGVFLCDDYERVF